MPTTSRDTQRTRVYTWEIQFDKETPTLTLLECEALVRKVFGDYGLTPPIVTDGRGRRSACYSDSGEIKLPRWARSEIVVLHECAHGILCKRNVACAWHGPEFMRVLTALIAHYMGRSLSEVQKSAREAGIKIGAVASAPHRPPTFAKREHDRLREQVREISQQIRKLDEEREALREKMREIKTW